MTTISLAELRALVGKETGVSDWITLDQAKIDAFAEVGGDHQFIHVDPARAAAEAPFGGTIAHGFLTVACMSTMLYQAFPDIIGTRMAVNYGFDKLRFLSPVRAGARVRGRFVLSKLDENRPGEVTAHCAITVEIEGEDRPALVADWINRYYLETQA